MSTLKSLCHENIVCLEDVYWVHDKHIYLIFEYMLIDLHDYITRHEPNGLRLTALQNYIYQITNAVKFCHERAVLHRDLKPENILIDAAGVVKVWLVDFNFVRYGLNSIQWLLLKCFFFLFIQISDFGLCRTMSVPIRAYSESVVTLWYRAPELILGDRYGCPLDIWSLGKCI